MLVRQADLRATRMDADLDSCFKDLHDTMSRAFGANVAAAAAAAAAAGDDPPTMPAADPSSVDDAELEELMRIGLRLTRESEAIDTLSRATGARVRPGTEAARPAVAAAETGERHMSVADIDRYFADNIQLPEAD